MTSSASPKAAASECVKTLTTLIREECDERDVAEGAEREGAVVPPWGWKEVRVHYELHATGNLVARHKMIRQLQVMRQQQEQRLVRVDNGEKELDRQGADLMLKVCIASPKSIANLFTAYTLCVCVLRFARQSRESASYWS